MNSVETHLTFMVVAELLLLDSVVFVLPLDVLNECLFKLAGLISPLFSYPLCFHLCSKGWTHTFMRMK